MGVLQTFVSEPSLVSWNTFKVFLKDYENGCLFVFSKKNLVSSLTAKNRGVAFDCLTAESNNSGIVFR